MKPAIVIGGGGHAKVLLNVLLEASAPILGYTDVRQQAPVLGQPWLGTDEIILKHHAEEVVLVNGLGCTNSTSRRAELFTRYKQLGYSFASVIHPSSVIGREVELGEGVQIMAGVVIQPGCRLGLNVILNTCASIDHDCIIGDHVHIAPGATLSGSVVIENRCHIGTGANIIQGRRIGTDSVVGAGALVLKDVPAQSIMAGVPARDLKP